MRRSVFIAGLVALSLGGAPALAFQEMPEPPPADVPAATPQLGPLQLGTPGGGGAPESEQGGPSMLGYPVLPKFVFGLDVDNHAINTVPKETLVRITKAEDGGIGGVGVWKPAQSGYSPGNETALIQQYLAGKFVTVQT